ncbi:hypothetical protein ACFC3F_05215 [Microbacterium sp. NPDC055910]|uniref:hypothetical protein n=1 Tax=Microbacterium sp. NPDC055910 TaxID=3345659 RepID=UPI0035E10327
MAGLIDFAKNIGQEALTRVRGVAAEHTDQAFEDGFNTAANICVQLVTDASAELTTKMSSTSLSDREQAQLAQLTRLKGEMEQALYAYWEKAATEQPSSSSR